MKWSFLKSFLATQSVFAIVGIVIVVANAPIFQNLGLDEQTPERYFLVSHYVTLIVSLFSLFFGGLLFELYCPELIKSNRSYLSYIEISCGREPNDDADETAVNSWNLAAYEATKFWNEENLVHKGRFRTSTALGFFLILFPLSFGSAVASLLLFAQTSTPSRKASPPSILRVELYLKSAVEGEGTRGSLKDHAPCSNSPAKLLKQ